MATNYTPLVTAWNSVTQPPAGVAGTALTGLTTDQKLAAVNAWTVVGAVAVPLIVPTYAIYNCIVLSEWQALTAASQQAVRDILSMGTVDASAGTQVRTVLQALFGAGTTTRTNLLALIHSYDTPTTLWWVANSFPAPINHNDLVAAGGLT